MPIPLEEVQFHPLGDTAVILQFGEDITPEIQQSVFAVSAFLDEYSFEGLVEYVPAYTGITLFYNSLTIGYEEIILNLKQMLGEIEVGMSAVEGRLWDIPVYYGGEYGPDLDLVAAYCGISTDELISKHSEPRYLVYMIGFAPGFPYLGGMDATLQMPRRTQPRSLVPAGSVGIAGKQTGIYSIGTPGGWQIIGRTPIKLFDLNAANPTLLTAGDRLRFIPISKAEFERMEYGD